VPLEVLENPLFKGLTAHEDLIDMMRWANPKRRPRDVCVIVESLAAPCKLQVIHHSSSQGCVSMKQYSEDRKQGFDTGIEKIIEEHLVALGYCTDCTV
jgi:hypothetical protein